MKISTVFIRPNHKKEHIYSLDIALILSIAAILTGFISGVLIYTLAKDSLSEELIKLFISFFYNSSTKTNLEFLSGLIMSVIPYILLMFIFALDLVGVPFALILTYFKTLAPTTLFSFLYCEYGLKGAEYVFLVLAAGELIALFGILLLCSATYRMSKKINMTYKSGKGEYPQEIRSFVPKFTVGTVIIIFSRFITFITVTSFSELFVF